MRHGAANRLGEVRRRVEHRLDVPHGGSDVQQLGEVLVAAREEHDPALERGELLEHRPDEISSDQVAVLGEHTLDVAEPGPDRREAGHEDLAVLGM